MNRVCVADEKKGSRSGPERLELVTFLAVFAIGRACMYARNRLELVPRLAVFASGRGCMYVCMHVCTYGRMYGCKHALV